MNFAPLVLDGSAGGGPLLRSALALSLATGRGFVIEKLPGGLDPSLLACVRAAGLVAGAKTEGAEAGSDRLLFEPMSVRDGDYLLDLGPGGSIPLVVELLAAPLALAGRSVLKLRGGTHLPEGPAFHFLSLVWLPAMRELGYDLDLELSAAGFGSEGGGEATLAVRGARLERSTDRRSRGTLREVRVLSTVSNLPLAIAAAQSERATQRLKEKGILAEAENIPVPAPRSRGSMCLVTALFERSRVGFAAVAGPEAAPGESGERAAGACVEFIRSRGALDPRLAEGLVVPMALAAAGLAGQPRTLHRFSTSRLTDALLAQAEAVGRFLEVEVAMLEAGEGEAEVRVAHQGASLLGALRPRLR